MNATDTKRLFLLFFPLFTQQEAWKGSRPMQKPTTAKTNPPATGCVLYARVSSEEQKQKETIETQIHVAKQQCEREGIVLGEIYRDEGVSGTVPFDERPDGKRLLTDARAGKFTTVLLYRVDRLGRLDVVSHVARHHLETLGVGLRSLTEPFDTSTPTGRFMFGILVSFSSMERESIKQRAKAGLHRVASEGRWANGRPPYGYRIAERQLVPDEQEAAVVKTIFALAATRHTLIAICEHLNVRGIPTREGKRWRFGQVAKMLHRPTYRGVHAWGAAETITRTAPSLVSEETWYQAQEALALNAKASRGNSKRDYLLKSLVQCAFCRRSMTGIGIEAGGSQHYYYRCTGKTDPDRTGPCVSRYPQAEWLEGLVWNTLADWILRREDIEQALRQAVHAQEEERQGYVETVKKLTQQLATKTAERDRMVGAFRRGFLSETDLARQLVEIDQEQHHLSRTIADLERRDLHLDTARLTAHISQHLDQYRKDVQRSALPFEKKRRIVEAFVQDVRVRVPKGAPCEGTVREVIPFREDAPQDTEGVRKTVWAREGQQPENSPPAVEVIYTFPWPQAESFMEISSPSPKKRSSIKTSSAIPA
jgi:site-specific DNA recombinase